MQVLTASGIEIVQDNMGRDIAVIPDGYAVALRAEVKRGWREFPGVADGESRFFPPGSWVHDSTDAIIRAYAGSPVPDGLDERDRRWSENARRAAREWGQCAGTLFIIGRSGWDFEARWWAYDVRAQEHRDVRVDPFPNRVKEYGGKQRLGIRYQG